MKAAADLRILEHLLAPVLRSLTSEDARALVDLRADAEAQARIDELADKCTEGQLSAEEHSEYAAYVSAINLISILQSKARALLAQQGATERP